MSWLIESASGDLAPDDHWSSARRAPDVAARQLSGPYGPPAGMRERLRDGGVRARDRGLISAWEDEIRGRIFGRIPRSAALWLHKPRCSAAAAGCRVAVAPLPETSRVSSFAGCILSHTR